MHKFIPSAMSWLNWLEQDQIRHSESWKWHIKRNAVTMWVVTTCTSHTECILNTLIWHGNCELNRRSNPILKWCYPYPNSICQTWKTQNTHWNYLCSITRVLPTTRQNGTSVDWATLAGMDELGRTVRPAIVHLKGGYVPEDWPWEMFWKWSCFNTWFKKKKIYWNHSRWTMIGSRISIHGCF